MFKKSIFYCNRCKENRMFKYVGNDKTQSQRRESVFFGIMSLGLTTLGETLGEYAVPTLGRYYQCSECGKIIKKVND